jgi:hypothetical protein
MHLPLPAADSEDALIAKYHGMLLGYAQRIGRPLSFRVGSEDLYQYGAVGILLQFRQHGDVNIRSAAWCQMMDGMRAEMRVGRFSVNNESCAGLTDFGRARDDIPAIEAAIDIRRLAVVAPVGGVGHDSIAKAPALRSLRLTYRRRLRLRAMVDGQEAEAAPTVE